MYPNLVLSVTEGLASDDTNKKYTIEFSPELGNVPDLAVIGSVNGRVARESEATKLGDKSQLIIDNMPTEPFDLRHSRSKVN